MSQRSWRREHDESAALLWLRRRPEGAPDASVGRPQRAATCGVLALGDEPGEQALVFVPRDTEMVVDPAGNAAVATLEDARSWIGMMIGDRGRTIDPDIAVYVLGLATRFIP